MGALSPALLLLLIVPPATVWVGVLAGTPVGFDGADDSLLACPPRADVGVLRAAVKRKMQTEMEY